MALFESKAGFPEDDTQAVCNNCFAIAELPMSISFDVPYGSYAVSVLHDENKDGELNTGLLGIPQEGIGFSNDPRIIKGTPSFEKTRRMHRKQAGLRNTVSWASPWSIEIRRHATHLYNRAPPCCGSQTFATHSLQRICLSLHHTQGATKSLGRRI